MPHTLIRPISLFGVKMRVGKDGDSLDPGLKREGDGHTRLYQKPRPSSMMISSSSSSIAFWRRWNVCRWRAMVERRKAVFGRDK